MPTLPKEEAVGFLDATGSDASSEGMMILCILIMMNARNVLSYEQVNNDKINKVRAKKGKPPLVAYKNVNFYVSPSRERSYHKNGMDVSQGVVLQKVTGHFRSRYSIQNQRRELFWLDAYQRGDATIGLGPSITHNRTVRIKMKRSVTT
jgi:hypothetical protein